MSHAKKMHNQAFTLIEILVVLAILGILTAAAIPSYSQYIAKARATGAITAMQRISKSIKLYHASTGRYPDSLADVYMDQLKDPWGNPYQYLNVANAKGKGKLRKDRNLVPINSDYDLYSAGPDGKSASPLTAKISRDDIVRAGNGTYYGIAEDY